MSSFPEEAFEHLADAEEGHFWFRSRNKLVTWALRRYFPAAKTLLEIGCGTGIVLASIRQNFPELRVVGTDLSPSAVHIARRRARTEVSQLDAREIDFRDEFDVVCAFDVLEHIEDDAEVLARLRRAVVPSGGLLVTVPQYRWLWSPADEYGGHYRRYDKRLIEGTIEQAGFTVMRSTAWVCSLLPLVALSRMWDRRRRSEFDPRRELMPPRIVNRSFERMLDLETASIRSGISLPFGSSRLVVARR